MKKYINETQRSTPVIGEYDVLVLGGGAAGMAAAVSAARHGANTLLVERYGFLGGTFSAALVCSFCGLHVLKDGQPFQISHGVVDDFLHRLDFYRGLNTPHIVMARTASQSFDVAAMKIVADEIVCGSGAKLLLHTLVVGVAKQGQKIEGVIVENKDGRGFIHAKTFIDCSGDGILGHMAGVPDLDQDANFSCQYPTMMFRVHNVNDEIAFQVGKPTFTEILLQANKSGNWYFPRTTGVLFPQHHHGEWRINVTQVQRKDGTSPNTLDAQELTDAEIEGRRQVAEMYRFLREKVPGFSECYLLEVPAELGIRQSRNLAGRYVLRGEQILEGIQIPFPIGVNTWPMENHVQGKISWTFPEKASHQIPMGSLIPFEIENLFFAGRCASFDSSALSSVRVSGPCMAMGQAVGAAAALGFSSSTVLDSRNYDRLKQLLLDDGVTL